MAVQYRALLRFVETQTGAPNRLGNRNLCSIYVVLAVCGRVQALRGAKQGITDVDFDRLCFDCRGWGSRCGCNRSGFGSNSPVGQFAGFLVVILRRARPWMASGRALDRAQARKKRKTRKLNLCAGERPLHSLRSVLRTRLAIS